MIPAPASPLAVAADIIDPPGRAADLEEWRDPVAWCRARGWDPWDGQVRMMEAAAKHRRLAIVGANGLGKGNFVAWRLYHWMMHPLKRARGMTGANTNDQVRENTWHEINEQGRRHGWPGQVLTQSWKLPDGRKAVGYTTDVEQALQGKHAEAFLLVIDESSGERLDDNWPIYKTLVSGDGQTIFIGNLDRRVGTFARAAKGKMGFHVIRVTATEAADYQLEHDRRIPGLTSWEKIAEWAHDLDAPIDGLEEWAAAIVGVDAGDEDDDFLPTLPPELLERVQAFAREELTEGFPHWSELDNTPPVTARDWWRVHVLALEPEGAAGGWFDTPSLEAARKRTCEQSGVWRAGLDIAGEEDGGDWTTGYARRGDYVERWLRTRATDHPTILEHFLAWAQEKADEHNARTGENKKPQEFVEVAVDATGEGSGLAQFIRREGYRVDKVHFGGGPKNPEMFANRGAEGYYHASQAIRGGAMVPDFDILQEDLEACQPVMRQGIKGRRVWALKPKPERKKELGRSPDDSDGYMLCFVPRVEPKSGISIL